MKSILLQIRDDDGLDSRIAAAIVLSRAFGGHITCLHVTPYQDYLVTDPLLATALPVDFSARMERLRLGLKSRVEAILDAETDACNWVHHDGPMADAFIRHSVLSDVIVLSLPGVDATSEASSFVASVATAARAPVLAVPRSGPSIDVTGAALVAWDGSEEASIALRFALPLLRRASSVHLLEVEEKAVRTGREPGATYLSRQGIDAISCHRLASSGDVGQAIVETAGTVDAALIVMGAYGHSRIREFFLGGATRTMLATSSVPLFLAH
jgi:nucleotide-binding universal stress UspA family protein